MRWLGTNIQHTILAYTDHTQTFEPITIWAPRRSHFTYCILILSKTDQASQLHDSNDDLVGEGVHHSIPTSIGPGQAASVKPVWQRC